MPAESRQRLSEMRTGAGNPNYGRAAGTETRAKMSAVRKGRPMPSSKRSAHTRYHTNMGRFKQSCMYCVEDLANQNASRPDGSVNSAVSPGPETST
ncbi:hypothetical protein IU435_07795 [Nocardia cyriacigeorgica]|nr:NUMOD3 domain-containing DNA-binding protein [Nocardia cyriacigeorgica]MBF6436327.1 hypothetical protein [Nocardia cyriacigeorgica]